MQVKEPLINYHNALVIDRRLLIVPGILGEAGIDVQ
jgi:hypothetical protein